MKKKKTVSIVITVIALLAILGIGVYGNTLTQKGNETAIIQFTLTWVSVVIPIIGGICCLIPAAARSGFAWLSTIIIALAAYFAPMIAAGAFTLVLDPAILLLLIGPCAAGFLVGSIIGLLRKKTAVA